MNPTDPTVGPRSDDVVGPASPRDARLPWLIVIDPQRIFADPSSDWAAPAFPAAMENIGRLASVAGEDRTLVTRWLPTADRGTAWGDYFAAWPFADVPADDPLYELVDAAQGLSAHSTIDEPTFGKWGPQLAEAVGAVPGGAERPADGAGESAGGAEGSAGGAAGPADGAGGSAGGTVGSAGGTSPAPHLLVTGVSTDCCVLTTVLAAADAGIRVSVVRDACAHSTPGDGEAALHVMGLFPPQVDVINTVEALRLL